MADWTKATLASKVLEFIKVKSPTQPTDASNTSLVEDVIDSTHALLRKRGLAPFATSAIPDWAKWPMVEIIAEKVAPIFNKKGFNGIRQIGEKALMEYTATKKHPYPIRTRYF